MRRILVLLASIPLVWLGFHFASDGAVLTAGNLVNLFKYLSVVGILSTGMTLVMAAGFIDLSVGSALGFLGAIQAWLLLQGMDLASSLAISLAAAVVIGLLHGSVVAFFRVPAFIVTLSGLMAYMGAKQYLANPVIPIRNETLLQLGHGYIVGVWGYALAAFGASLFAFSRWQERRSLLHRKLPAPSRVRSSAESAAALVFALGGMAVFQADRGLPICVLAMALGALAAHVLITRLRFGRHVFALGSNREAALYSGLPLFRITIGVFVVMAVYAWLAGLVATSQLMAGAADIGDYQELYAIAACVIGGTSLSGGTGNVWMSLLGALLMASILNGMEQVGIPSPVQKMILGLILTAAVAVDQWASRREA